MDTGIELDQLIAAMTLEEKASLCSGRNAWSTKAIPRLGIPSLTLADGPHGLRKQPGEGDFLGVNISLPATCFPAACTTACSWDPDLLRQIGAALGEECLQEQVDVLLAPGVNIKRNPLCGRNFEYFSEDPLLAGELATTFIEGLQAQGVGASLKHFAANNQETRRMTSNALVDERALREIYLSAFEQAVKRARPWTVMAAYNQLNGAYCSEHPTLLTSILRDEWGFAGAVVTDWGACNDRVSGLRAGQDLEMPGGGADNDQAIVAAIRSGQVPEAVLDQAVKRLLALTFQAQRARRSNSRYDAEAHHRLARQAATQSAVLLKNEGNLLPLAPSTTLAVIGGLAEKMRYQGSGSSMVNPLRLEQPLDALAARGVPVRYAPGYSRLSVAADERLLKEACRVARDAESVVVVLGLTDLAESEGFDRAHMRLPANQTALIERLAALRSDLIVVLFGGSPIEMPWLDQIKAVLHLYLPGQAGGSALAALLFGDANPSGKLAETYPLRYEDTASARYFPGNGQTVEYRESIFVGYRYFDTARQPVRFPFGHGLSYTTFAYQGLALSTTDLSETDTVQVSLTVTNTGTRAGAEVVQLYVHECEASVFTPEKALRGFRKVLLQPGETGAVAFSLTTREFAHYDVATADWVVDSGAFEILLGASSQDLRLRERVTVRSTHAGSMLATPNELAPYRQLASNKGTISAQAFAALYGSAYAQMTRGGTNAGARPFTVNSTLEDLRVTPIGRLLRRIFVGQAVRMVVDADPERQIIARKMIEETVANSPLRALASSSAGSLTRGMAEGLALLANGQFLRGLLTLLRARPPQPGHRSRRGKPAPPANEPTPRQSGEPVRSLEAASTMRPGASADRTRSPHA